MDGSYDCEPKQTYLERGWVIRVEPKGVYSPVVRKGLATLSGCWEELGAKDIEAAFICGLRL